MSKTWSFYPEEKYESPPRAAYVPRKEKRQSWVAPEHARIAQAMKKDFPRDDLGVPLPERKKELVVDPRPTIMIPPRPTRYGLK